MPSQFFGLYIAGSGLRASNAALNTTANNIANAQTDGYSRQEVIQEASEALRTFTTYGCAGAGVDTIAIERVRDDFYDLKYWNNQTKYGEYESKQYYMATIEDYFNDDGKTGFKTVFDKLTAALQGIDTNASSTSAKATFVSSAKSVVDYFNNMYGNLQALQKDVNAEIKIRVDQINSLAEKIATVTKQINVIELTGSHANELRDQRDALIDELSELVDVEATEYKIYDTNDPTRETGGTRYLVTIAGGQPLVDSNDYNRLVCVARKDYEKVNQSDVDGLYEINWENGNSFDLTNGSLGGQLRGLVDMRDGTNGQYFHGNCVGVGVAEDGHNSTVTIHVTDSYLTDMKKAALSDTGGIISVGNTKYYYKDWTYDKETQNYTFTLDNDRCDSVITGSKIQKDAKIGFDCKYQGIPYYMAQMNEWVRGFSEVVNQILSTGYDINGNHGCMLFTATTIYGEITDPKTFTDDDNLYYEMTAGNVSILSALVENADLLGTRTDPTLGVEECGIVEKMIDMIGDKKQFSFRNSSAGEFLNNILSDCALNASSANTFYNTYQGLQTTIANQRTSISGVDEDEEAVSLVKYQNSYTLASKMVQTLTEIYDQLILSTGV